MAVSTDPETFCSGRGILVMEIGASYDSPPTMMHTDPPEHTVYRKLVQPGFAPGRMRALEADVRRRAKLLVDEIEAGRAVDFVETVAGAFPPANIRAPPRMPAADGPALFEWSGGGVPRAPLPPAGKSSAPPAALAHTRRATPR